MTMRLVLHDRLGRIDAALWDRLACPECADGGRPRDPFLTHRFLVALEESGSVGAGTGWHPSPALLEEEETVVGAAPLWIKEHSFGEYVFDHGWADAWERAGGRYYPKLQLAVPFTPVTGRRLLVAGDGTTAEMRRRALIEGLVEAAERNGLSSLHVTFCSADEARAGTAAGLLHRRGMQYHWFNRGYADFDAFLAALSSARRKTIRKERRRAQAAVDRIARLTGADIRPEHWDAFWRFYQDTGARKWGRPYLTRSFFEILHETMRDDVLLVLAFEDGEAVAGALNFIGRDALFGRWWGASVHKPFLHFELCYYQAIEHAIECGLARVEAGAQGEHKVLRGYEPVATHSLHWLADPRLAAAVADFIAEETELLAREGAYLARDLPYRATLTQGASGEKRGEDDER